MHFARSIVLGYHSIPKIKWASFRARRKEKWGSFRGRFGDHFGGRTGLAYSKINSIQFYYSHFIKYLHDIYSISLRSS